MEANDRSSVVGEAKVTINRPVADVFAFVADLTNEPRWHTDILKVRPAPDSPAREGLGSTWIVTARFMGRREYEVEVTGFEPNRRIEYTTRTGPLKPTAACLLEPADGGTLFTRQVQIPIQGLHRLAKPMLQRMAPKRQAGFVHNLKHRLERGVD